MPAYKKSAIQQTGSPRYNVAVVHPTVSSVSLEEVDELLNAICARAEAWQLQSGWWPILTDPDDEPLAQLACESAANRIVTHNVRHLAPAGGVGIEILKPGQFLAILRSM